MWSDSTQLLFSINGQAYSLDGTEQMVILQWFFSRISLVAGVSISGGCRVAWTTAVRQTRLSLSLCSFDLGSLVLDLYLLLDISVGSLTILTSYVI